MVALKDITKTSNLGLRFASASTGWTPPVDIYERMRATNVDAVRLDGNMLAYVADPVLRNAWNAWYAHWKALFEKYAGPNAGFNDKASVALYRSDELSQQAREEDARLRSFYDDYNRQRQINGAPVPRLGVPAPIPPTPPVTSGMPWWFWMLGGIGVVGLGYLAYRKVQEGIAKKKVLDKYTPSLLDKYLGPFGKPAHEYSKAGRDPDLNLKHDLLHDRDPNPFQLSAYARDSSPSTALHDIMSHDVEHDSPSEERDEDYMRDY